jgi:hypothetical protein
VVQAGSRVSATIHFRYSGWPPTRGVAITQGTSSACSRSARATISGTSGAESADQPVLQVGDAHEGPERLQIPSPEPRSEAGALETPPEVAFLPRVAQTGHPEAATGRTEGAQERPDVRRTAHRDEGDALGGQVPAAALGKRDPATEPRR